MWKYIFEFCDRLFTLIPVKKWRNYLRIHTLFDYRRKFDALKSKYKNITFRNMRLSKGGGSIVFIIDNKTTFKVRKYSSESGEFDRFTREKKITDGLAALRKKTDIKFPQITFVKINGYTFYKTDFIPGKLLINIPTWKIKKYQNQISNQLAEFIYQKSIIKTPDLDSMQPKTAPKDACWVHGDMCSNILINPKTMKITGIIDWEWTVFSTLDKEFYGLVRVRKKMRKIGLDKSTKIAFEKFSKK